MHFTRFAAWSAPLAGLALGLPLLVHSTCNPIEFNQFLLQRLASQPGNFHAAEAWAGVKSAFVSGVGILERRPSRTAPELTDSRAMFSHIFSWIPEYAVAYPTERFYYFKLQVGEREVMGNVRLAELDQGRVSFAYFTLPDKETWIRTVGAEDGLEVEKLSSSEYRVTFEGKTVTFEIQRSEIRGPSKLATLPAEEVVGQLFDESGIRLFVLYNNATNSFYEVLNDEDGVADELLPVGDTSFVVGKRTGFVFYVDKDYRRTLLVGVDLENVKKNNYLDGPGDQVPIALDLRDKMHVAYPNTLLGDGIDEHGVYLKKNEWSRIAVSPYTRYASLAEFPERLLSCAGEQDRSVFWTCLTKEWWNTAPWRESIFTKLASEGKHVDTSKFVWTR